MRLLPSFIYVSGLLLVSRPPPSCAGFGVASAGAGLGKSWGFGLFSNAVIEVDFPPIFLLLSSYGVLVGLKLGKVA